jgi:hypothetical protein
MLNVGGNYFAIPIISKMIYKIFLTISILISWTFSSCAQTQRDNLKVRETYARKQLKIALSDKSIHNVINSKALIIKNKGTAIKVIEPILFDIYGEDNITRQRPYEAYLIDNYWIVSGTLPEGYDGGTFLIIVDATNSKVIRLTHGK